MGQTSSPATMRFACVQDGDIIEFLFNV